MRHSLIVGLVALGLAACSSLPAPVTEDDAELRTAATTTLAPTSYRTTRGADGGQPVANLAVRDQSGSQNTWTKYVEFGTPGVGYIGTRSYTLPESVSPSAITGLRVEANFLGPAKSAQAWRWRVYNFSSGRWDLLGDNSGSSWGAWKGLSFSASGTLKNYVSSSREIRVRTDSSNATDDADLDYEAVVVTHGGGGTTPPPPPPSGGSWWKPQKGLSWWWQLENTGSLNTNLNVDVYDIDLYDSSTSRIAALRGKGYKVVCYFSAGTYEEWRSDAGDFNTSDLGSPLDDWPGEWWVDVRSSNVREVMKKRLALARQKGCDAVEPDNVDGYTNNPGFPLTVSDQTNYNRFLAQEAHARGLAIGLKNNLEDGQLAALVNDFDFAVNEECYVYSRECDKYLNTFLAQNKPVFSQEYGSISEQTYLRDACPYFRAKGIASLWKRSYSLDGNGVVQCQP